MYVFIVRGGDVVEAESIETRRRNRINERGRRG